MKTEMEKRNPADEGGHVRPILRSLDDPAHHFYLYAAGATLATTIVVRFAWVRAHSAVARWRSGRSRSHPSGPTSPPTVRGSVIVAWCGMRGIVTLAAALALPTASSGEAFPHRDFIVLTAFCVVLGTLVLQGLTLRPLLHALALPDDDLVGREVGKARERALRAAFETLEGDLSAEAEAVRREYTPLRGEAAPGEVAGAPENELRRRAMIAARRAVLEMRATDEIGDAAFHRVEEELDWAEMSRPFR